MRACCAGEISRKHELSQILVAIADEARILTRLGSTCSIAAIRGFSSVQVWRDELDGFASEANAFSRDRCLALSSRLRPSSC